MMEPQRGGARPLNHLPGRSLPAAREVGNDPERNGPATLRGSGFCAPPTPSPLDAKSGEAETPHRCPSRTWQS